MSPSSPIVLPDVSNVALVDAATSAAIGAMSVSWWHSQVAAGRAPQPVIRSTRCTRWRLADVKSFWADYPAQLLANSTTRDCARKASAAARAKRQAMRRQGAQA